MQYTAIKTGRLADDVSNQIKEAIFQDDYKPGEKIPSEQQLVDLFGVSRVIVREAIRNLEQAGLVEIRRGPKGGAFVKTLTHTAVSLVVKDLFRLAKGTVKEVMEVRLEIEPIVTGLAARRATENDLLLLKKHLDNMPKESGRKMVEANTNFHRLLAKCAHNPIYYMIINILLDFSIDLIINILPPGKIIHDTTSHPEIYELVAKGHSQQARTRMKTHLQDIIPLMQEVEARTKAGL